MNHIILDGATLTAAQVVAVARNGAHVQLHERARTQLQTTRDYIDANWMTDDAPMMYSFNTGVGALKSYASRPI